MAETSNPKWAVHNDQRWINDLLPTLGNTTVTGTLDVTMLAFRDQTLSAVTAIPADGAGSGGDDYILSGNYILKNGFLFVCKYNDIQDMINSELKTQIERLKVLQGTAYLDVNHTSEDTLWWADVDSIDTDLQNLVTAHVGWRNDYTNGVADDYNDVVQSEGNPSTLADTFQDEIGAGAGIDFYDVCFGSGTGRFEEIETRIGNPDIENTYSYDLYQQINLMVGKDINYVGDVIKDFFAVSSFYDTIIEKRGKYRIFEEAENNV